MKEACDHLSAELSQSRASLAQTGQRERRSSTLVQELTAMVKEQKRRISELSHDKKEAVQELKVPFIKHGPSFRSVCLMLNYCVKA